MSHPVGEIGMDERVEVAILQFECEGEIKALGRFGDLVDDPQAMLDIAHVVIGQFENEEPFGQRLHVDAGGLEVHVFISFRMQGFRFPASALARVRKGKTFAGRSGGIKKRSRKREIQAPAARR